MFSIYTLLLISSVLIFKPKVGLSHEDRIFIVNISSKGDMVNSKSELDSTESSGGILFPISDRCKCVTFGGSSFIGKSFIPSSNLACLAILMRSVSISNQSIFREECECTTKENFASLLME